MPRKSRHRLTESFYSASHQTEMKVVAEAAILSRLWMLIQAVGRIQFLAAMVLRFLVFLLAVGCGLCSTFRFHPQVLAGWLFQNMVALCLQH